MRALGPRVLVLSVPSADLDALQDRFALLGVGARGRRGVRAVRACRLRLVRVGGACCGIVGGRRRRGERVGAQAREAFHLPPEREDDGHQGVFLGKRVKYLLGSVQAPATLGVAPRLGEEDVHHAAEDQGGHSVAVRQASELGGGSLRACHVVGDHRERAPGQETADRHA